MIDLAEGHRAALDCLLAEAPQAAHSQPGQRKGLTVLEVLQAMEAASGRFILHTITERRPL